MKKNAALLAIFILFTVGCGANKSGEESVTIKEKHDYYNDGINYLKNAEVKNAVQSFYRAIKNNPADVKSYVILGQIYLKLNKPLEALDIFSAAVKAAPNSAIANYMLANCQLLVGEKTSALVSVNKSLVFAQKSGDVELFKKAMLLRRVVVSQEPPAEVTPKDSPAGQNHPFGNETQLKLAGGIVSLQASSYAHDTYEGKPRSWEGDNLIDGNLDSHWCTADNVREWAYIKLDKDYPVSTIGFINGNGFWHHSQRPEAYYKDARIKNVRIELSNGWQKDIYLEDHGAWQYFDIGGQKSDFIKITVLALYPRLLWSHACLSEMEIFAQK